MGYTVSQEQMVYRAIHHASQNLWGSGVDALSLIYFLQRDGREVHHIKPAVPASQHLSPETQSRVDDFAKRVNEYFAELKSKEKINS